MPKLNETEKSVYIMNEQRIIAIDSIKHGFKISRNKHYYIALISTLFDIERKIPINYNLSTNCNERYALILHYHF